jgi:hypothetical protein
MIGSVASDRMIRKNKNMIMYFRFEHRPSIYQYKQTYITSDAIEVSTMLIPLLISCGLGIVALTIKARVTEEIEALGAGLVAIVCLFLSLVFAPLFIKILLLIVIFVTNKEIFAISADSNLSSYS